MSKITQSARGQPCIRCKIDDGTIAARHYNGLQQIILGKGRGMKLDDINSAEFCYECDKLFSEGVNPTGDGMRASDSIDRSQAFLFYIALTNRSRTKRGLFE